MLLFWFWILGCFAWSSKDFGCQWWPFLGFFWGIRLRETEWLSKETQAFIAWFTSTRGVYRVWLRCQSQPSLFRAKESPLKKEIRKRTTCVLKCVVEIQVLWNPWQEKALPVGWKFAQWSYELEKKTQSSAFTSPKDLDVHLALLLGRLAPVQSGCCQSVSQSEGHKRQNYAKCLQQPVFPGGHPSKY